MKTAQVSTKRGRRGADRSPGSRPASSRTGSVLVLATVVLGTVMVLTAAFLRVGIRSSRGHNSSLEESQAFFVAEAAISEAGAAIVAGRSGNIGSQAAPAIFGEGVVWVEATDLGSDDYQLDATALCNGGRAALRVVVHATRRPSFNHALTSDLSLQVGSNFLVDSYDPALGSYASQPTRTLPGHNDAIVGTKGGLASNGSIQLSSNDRIYGDATPGPGGGVTGLGGNTFVHGSTAPAARPIDFPPVLPPPIPSQGTKYVRSSDPAPARTIGPGDAHYASLTVGGHATLTIRGPAEVVIDALATTAGCTIHIDASAGPVNLYFTGSCSFVSNMNVTSTAPSAKSVTMNFTSNSSVDLAPNATFLGRIYAPSAWVTLGSNWVNHGAITGQNVRVSSNVRLHYDESLSTPWRDQRTSLRVLSWTTRGVPRELRAQRTDPCALLGVQRGNLLRSSDAYR